MPSVVNHLDITDVRPSQWDVVQSSILALYVTKYPKLVSIYMYTAWTYY